MKLLRLLSISISKSYCLKLGGFYGNCCLMYFFFTEMSFHLTHSSLQCLSIPPILHSNIFTSHLSPIFVRSLYYRTFSIILERFDYKKIHNVYYSQFYTTKPPIYNKTRLLFLTNEEQQ